MAGAIAMAFLVIALFFLRFWRNTGDRFFLYFFLSFLIQAGHRIFASLPDQSVLETEPHHYLVRLLAYSMILWAIVEKNWPRRKHGREGTPPQ